MRSITVLVTFLTLIVGVAVGAQEHSWRKAQGNCAPGLHSSPTGPFAAMIYCEDALGDHLAVIYAAPIGAPEDEGGKWSLVNRYWFDPLWASDITGFKWSSDGRELFVSTSEIYGSGGLFKLDLFKRKATQLLPKGKPVSLDTPGPGFSIEGSLLEPYSQASSSHVLVGIMENDRSVSRTSEKEPDQRRVVRPLFEKKKGEWEVSTNHREDIAWAIAFDGKNKGTIRSQVNTETNNTVLNTDTHVPVPQPGQSLVFNKPSSDFSGWQIQPYPRPLVLVSKGGFEDPDGWKPQQLSKDQLKLARSAFRAEFPVVLNCDEHEKAMSDPWSYKDTDITITKSYRSNTGDLLVSAFLEGGRCGIRDGAFLSQLFLLKPDKSVRHLTINSKRGGPSEGQLSLILVDAGDYDTDGKSEVVFFATGYNEDGYVMFYDSFHKHVLSTWTYH